MRGQRMGAWCVAGDEPERRGVDAGEVAVVAVGDRLVQLRRGRRELGALRAPRGERELLGQAAFQCFGVFAQRRPHARSAGERGVEVVDRQPCALACARSDERERGDVTGLDVGGVRLENLGRRVVRQDHVAARQCSACGFESLSALSRHRGCPYAAGRPVTSP